MLLHLRFVAWGILDIRDRFGNGVVDGLQKAHDLTPNLRCVVSRTNVLSQEAKIRRWGESTFPSSLGQSPESAGAFRDKARNIVVLPSKVKINQT